VLDTGSGTGLGDMVFLYSADDGALPTPATYSANVVFTEEAATTDTTLLANGTVYTLDTLAVPEPSTFVLVSLGGITMLLFAGVGAAQHLEGTYRSAGEPGYHAALKESGFCSARSSRRISSVELRKRGIASTLATRRKAEVLPSITSLARAFLPAIGRTQSLGRCICTSRDPLPAEPSRSSARGRCDGPGRPLLLREQHVGIRQVGIRRLILRILRNPPTGDGGLPTLDQIAELRPPAVLIDALVGDAARQHQEQG
jgi:hypothetical protein